MNRSAKSVIVIVYLRLVLNPNAQNRGQETESDTANYMELGSRDGVETVTTTQFRMPTGSQLMTLNK